MLSHVKTYQIPTTICTMYRPNFENPLQKDMSAPGLSALNDVIISEAIKVMKKRQYKIFQILSTIFSSLI